MDAPTEGLDMVRAEPWDFIEEAGADDATDEGSPAPWQSLLQPGFPTGSPTPWQSLMLCPGSPTGTRGATDPRQMLTAWAQTPLWRRLLSPRTLLRPSHAVVLALVLAGALAAVGLAKGLRPGKELSGGSVSALKIAAAVTFTSPTTSTSYPQPKGPHPTLFCWTHIMPRSQEEELVRMQCKEGLGVFACNEAAVLSANETEICEANGVKVEAWWVPTEPAPKGRLGFDGQKTNSYLNARTFMKNWVALINSGHLWAFDFIVKVDADAVFFPDRLRAHIPRDKVGENVYFANCGENPEQSLFGALEVFSATAIRWYAQRMDDCEALPWTGWGEDFFMQQCMNILFVEQDFDAQQVGDALCDPVPCSDRSRAAFHPYRTAEEWLDCHAVAVATTTSTITRTRTTTSSTITMTSTTVTATSTSTVTTTTTVTSTATTTTTTHTTTLPTGTRPMLFCWSHVQPRSYEVKLVEMQLWRRASIFACNGFAVLSSETFEIGVIDNRSITTWYNPAREVTMGKYGVNGQKTNSYLNTKTFLEAWDSLFAADAMWHYDFVVKADPDAVFFPDRLRKHVKPHVDQKVYFANCGIWASGPKMYGALEVFSVPALVQYARQSKVCKQMEWKGWGEDYYMQHCMDSLGIAQVSDFNQVGDDRCVGAPCTDWTKVAYHDFKDPDDWYHCFRVAIGEIDD